MMNSHVKTKNRKTQNNDKTPKNPPPTRNLPAFNISKWEMFV